MDIDLKQFKMIVNRLLDHVIETKGITKVELDQNFYWDLPPSALYDVSRDPAQWETGSLEDDMEFILQILDDASQPVAYQLTEVAPLVRFIGEKLAEEPTPDGS